MIRIAFFAPLLITGGTQRHLQQVLRLLDRRRFVAEVFTLRPGGEVEAELRAAGVLVTPLGIGRVFATPGTAVASRAARRARRGADRARVPVAPGAVGAVAARLAGVPRRSPARAHRRRCMARRAWRWIARQPTRWWRTPTRCARRPRRGGGGRGGHPNGVDTEWFAAAPRARPARAALGSIRPAR
jgi:hypothetical protein